MLKRKRENITKTPEKISPKSKGVLLMMKLQNLKNEKDYDKIKKELEALEDIKKARQENKKAMEERGIVFYDTKTEDFKELQKVKQEALSLSIKYILKKVGNFFIEKTISMITFISRQIKYMCWDPNPRVSLIRKLTDLSSCVVMGGIILGYLFGIDSFILIKYTSRALANDYVMYIAKMVCSLSNIIVYGALLKIYGPTYFLVKNAFDYVFGKHLYTLCITLLEFNKDPMGQTLKITGLDILYTFFSTKISNVKNFFPNMSVEEKTKMEIAQNILNDANTRLENMGGFQAVGPLDLSNIAMNYDPVVPNLGNARIEDMGGFQNIGQPNLDYVPFGED